MKTLLEQTLDLWRDQLVDWPLAAKFYGSLSSVKTREFVLGGIRILAQYNPARAASTTAQTDQKSIAQRPCFLCDCNRPPEQRSVDAGEFWILLNPFPIFEQHFTLPHKQHTPQQILPYYADFLFFAKELSDFIVFYNGPRCGASAPDHLHFQAGTKGVLPLVDDFMRLRDRQTECIDSYKDAVLLRLKGMYRKVLVIESETAEASLHLFERLYASLPGAKSEEPMMNVVGMYENGMWIVFIMPRIAFRPSQYHASGQERFLISPAAVEMAGILITPVEEHFDRLTSDTIVSIYKQISPDEP